MNIIKIIKKVVFYIITKIYSVVHKLIKTDEKTIIFIAYLGKGYMCNPKYIHQYLLQDSRFKDFKFIWALKDASIDINGAKTIKYRSLEYFYYLAKSKFWIVNCKLPKYCLKKENQVYIQTWHGTPLKQLAHDIDVNENTVFYRSKQSREEMVQSYDDDVIKYDYLISPNSYTTDIFESCFKIDKSKIKEYGYPRNDYLVNLTQNEINNLKNRLSIPKEKKVILYAPTWRDNNFNDKGYVFNLEVDFKKWKSYLGEEWVVLFKPHYLISNKFDLSEVSDFVKVFKENIDINELYAVSDMLITDYSSVFFDYSILNRPICFYMYDLKDYEENLRGLYLDIHKDLPGPICENEKDLLEIIKNKTYENDYYKNKLNKFSDKFMEKGISSKLIADNIILKMNKF